MAVKTWKFIAFVAGAVMAPTASAHVTPSFGFVPNSSGPSVSSPSTKSSSSLSSLPTTSTSPSPAHRNPRFGFVPISSGPSVSSPSTKSSSSLSSLPTTSTSPSPAPPLEAKLRPSLEDSSFWSVPSSNFVERSDAMRSFLPPQNLAPTIGQDRPIPTNAWWGNLIAYDASERVQPVWSMPYAVVVDKELPPYGFSISYPYRSRVSGGSSGNQGASRYYTHEIVRELQFSAMEFNAKPIFEVTDWTDLGVSMYLKPQSKGQGEIQSNLVSGMAYITSKYILLTPKLTTSASITHINGVSTESQREVEGSTLKLTLSNGQTWVLYGLSMDGTRSQILRFRLTDQNASTLESDTVFNGILRVALIMKEEQDKVLDQYKHCIVTGANVNIENDTTSYAFKFQTEGSCTQQGLLHYAMQHQVTSIDQQSAFQIQDMVANSTTRGPLQAYVTSTNTTFTGNTTWQLNIPKENQVPVSFYPMNSPNITLVKKYHLLDQLKKDIEAEWSLPFDGSFYFNGKAAQKYASLCLIANDIKITGNEQNILLKKCTEKLRQVLQNYIYNQWKYPLLYDLLYKGLISSEGIITRNVYADFGNTMYNDHHYHYGYWIHTSAVMNQLDPTWEFLPQLNQMTNLLIRDVASCGRDLYFPSYRHFDWYRGHSFSHGITSSMDGKNEESISEDINFSNSLMLYGKVLNNPRLYINGKIMASIQVETINKYFLFHLDDDDKNHPLPPPPSPPPHLLKQNQVTGILFENKIIYTTWFSNEKFCIHGIQMLPMISLSFVYRTKNFIQQEWNDILSKEQIVLQNDFTNPWLSILYVNYARINQEKAMNILQKTQMDDGLSKSWALYLATFPS